jgi:hypothetical protein
MNDPLPCTICGRRLHYVPTLTLGWVWQCSRCHYYAGQVGDCAVAGMAKLEIGHHYWTSEN